MRSRERKRTYYGVPIGILMLDTRFQRFNGDIGNAQTWPFPVQYKIVHGAVSMVEMALKELSAKQVVDLDDERKAAMVSNLMTVLCAESEVQPVINTGTLYNG